MMLQASSSRKASDEDGYGEESDPKCHLRIQDPKKSKSEDRQIRE